jgi:hypothetical protein
MTPLLVLGLCKLQMVIIDLWDFNLMSLMVSPIPEIDTFFGYSYPGQSLLIAAFYNSSYIWDLSSGKQVGYLDAAPLIFSMGDPILHLNNSIYYLQDYPAEIFQWQVTNFWNGNEVTIPKFYYSFPSGISDAGVWISIPSTNNLLVFGRSISSNTYCIGSYLISISDTQPPGLVITDSCITMGNYVPFSGIMGNSTTAVILVEYGDMEIILALVDPTTLSAMFESVQWSGYYIFPEELVAVPEAANGLFPFDFILNFQAAQMNGGSEMDVLMPFLMN